MTRPITLFTGQWADLPFEEMCRLASEWGYDGPRHFDFKPPRTEDEDGVWASAAGCMRTYLILKDRAAAFRSDPRVVEALAAAGVGDLRQPTIAPGESLAEVRAASYDVEALGRRGCGFEVLDQLATDHLLGAV